MDPEDINREAELAARLALTRILQALFEEATDAVDSDPPDYLSDMYCLLRATQIASVPFHLNDAPDENEDEMRQTIDDMAHQMIRLQRIYGLEGGLIDTVRNELLPRSTY